MPKNFRHVFSGALILTKSVTANPLDPHYCPRKEFSINHVDPSHFTRSHQGRDTSSKQASRNSTRAKLQRAQRRGFQTAGCKLNCEIHLVGYNQHF